MTDLVIISTSNVKKVCTFWNLGFTPLIAFLFVANKTEIFSVIYQGFPICASNCKIKSSDGWEKDSNEYQIGILSVAHIKESYKTLFVCDGTSGKAHYYRYMSSWVLPQMLLWENEHNKGIIGKTTVILSRTSTSYGKRLIQCNALQCNKWRICKKKPTLRTSFQDILFAWFFNFVWICWLGRTKPLALLCYPGSMFANCGRARYNGAHRIRYPLLCTLEVALLSRIIAM